MSASDSQYERHIQNSNTDHPSESDDHEESEGREPAPDHSPGRAGKGAPERKTLSISLERLLKACPEIGHYAPGGLSGFADLVRTADLVRSTLGISPDAWKKALDAMGPPSAAAVIAMMLERADDIRSPGGYLRNLTQQARDASFSLLPMLQALERQRDGGGRKG